MGQNYIAMCIAKMCGNANMKTQKVTLKFVLYGTRTHMHLQGSSQSQKMERTIALIVTKTSENIFLIGS